jgi:hypothetical protein
MPARVRLLLASLCLLIAPLVVMAGEFPGDTNTITSLTVEQAKQLAESFPGVVVHISGIWYDQCYEKGLPLRGLREFDVDVAKVLAKSNLNVLVLDGLTALDTECAKALAEFKGDLILNGLARLDAATATALAKCGSQRLCLNGLTKLDAATGKPLAEFEGQDLNLDGLTVLDAATAESLAQFKGRVLSLSGLAKLDATTAKALAQFKGEDLSLCGLSTLDPDTAKALVESAAWNGDLSDLTSLDTATAKALAEFRGNAEFMHDLMLNGLERASFGAVRVLRNRPNVYMPNPWYLLREQIAALVGTVVFVIMAGIVVWHSRRQRAAG